MIKTCKQNFLCNIILVLLGIFYGVLVLINRNTIDYTYFFVIVILVVRFVTKEIY